jgi:hypothetical protein
MLSYSVARHPRKKGGWVHARLTKSPPTAHAGVAAALAGDEQLEFILSEAGDGEAALALIASRTVRRSA